MMKFPAKYILPEDCQSVELIVYDFSGNEVLRQVTEENRTGTDLVTGNLHSVLYFVNLLVDGQKLQTAKLLKN